jgi:hypothetical protein
VLSILIFKYQDVFKSQKWKKAVFPLTSEKLWCISPKERLREGGWLEGGKGPSFLLKLLGARSQTL